MSVKTHLFVPNKEKAMSQEWPCYFLHKSKLTPLKNTKQLSFKANMASTYLNWELLGDLLKSWRSQTQCTMGLFAEQGSGSSCSGSHSPAGTVWSVGTAWRRSQRGHPGEWLRQRCCKPWSSGWAVGPVSVNWSLGFYQRRHARHTQDPCTWLQQKWGLVVPPGGLHWRCEGRTVLLLYSDPSG